MGSIELAGTHLYSGTLATNLEMTGCFLNGKYKWHNPARRPKIQGHESYCYHLMSSSILILLYSSPILFNPRQWCCGTLETYKRALALGGLLQGKGTFVHLLWGKPLPSQCVNWDLRKLYCWYRSMWTCKGFHIDVGWSCYHWTQSLSRPILPTHCPFHPSSSLPCPLLGVAGIWHLSSCGASCSLFLAVAVFLCTPACRVYGSRKMYYMLCDGTTLIGLDHNI